MKFFNLKFLSILVALFVMTQIAVPVKSFAGGGSRPSYASGPCPCPGSGRGAGTSGGGIFGSSSGSSGLFGGLGDLIALPFRAVGAVGSWALNTVGSIGNGIGSIFGGGSGSGNGMGTNGGASRGCAGNGYSCVNNGSRNMARDVSCATPGACNTGSCYPSGGVVYAQPTGGMYAQPTGTYTNGGVMVQGSTPTAAPVYNSNTAGNVQPSATCPDPAANNNGVYVTPNGAASIAL